MENKKVLVGVSGGPDSIYLLNKLYNEEGYEPIAVHVNYHLREESDSDQKLVEDFCNKRDIQLIIKQIKSNDWEEVSYLKNKQSMAREQRYNLYIDIANKMNIKDIFIGHHKNDFLETAMMQEKRSNDLLFYGIKELNIYKGLNIHRPLLNMFKEDIINELNELNIKFAIDKSNLEPTYERNKLRIQLSNLSKEEIESKIEKFRLINESKDELRKNVNESFNKLKDSEYDWNVFDNIKPDIKKYVVYKMLIENSIRINISKEKLEGIIDFLKNKKGDKSYRLMENLFISVKSSKIIIYEKK